MIKLLLVLIFVFLSQSDSKHICITCDSYYKINIESVNRITSYGTYELLSLDATFLASSDAILSIISGSILVNTSGFPMPNHIRGYSSVDRDSWDGDGRFSIPIAFSENATALDVNDTTAVYGNSRGAITFSSLDDLSGIIRRIDGLSSFPITNVAMHPENDYAAAVSNSQELGIYFSNLSEIFTFNIYDEFYTIYDVNFNSDGAILAALIDNAIYLWDGVTFNLLHIHRTQSILHQLLFDPNDPNSFITISGDRPIKWQWEEGHLRQILTFDPANLRTPLHVSKSSALNYDGSILIAIYAQREIEAWNTQTGEIIWIPALDELKSAVYRYHRDIFTVAFSPDGFWLVFGSGFGSDFYNIPEYNPYFDN